MSKDNLTRFIEAQKDVYKISLQEVKNGKKVSHWMWYIFPQIQGLGHSETAIFYAIKDKREAIQYLNHPILGERLVEISNELLRLRTNDSVEVLGYTDSLKLKSSMTLFSLLDNSNSVFQKVLDKFFDGKKDENTIHIINR